MRNDCPFQAPPILEFLPGRHILRRSLRKHRRHEATTLRAAGKRRGSKASQRLGGPSKGWEDFERVLQYQELLYVPEIIRFEVISCHHNDPLAEHFGIDKTRELIGRKYYRLSLRRDVESYVQGCDVCLTSKAICYKPYRDLQSLPIPTHR